MAYFNGYTPQQSNDLYPTTGTSDDWAYGELGIAAYTYEMGTTFFQSCSTFENTIYPDNLPAILTAFKSARRPYMNPPGPDSLNIAVTPETVYQGLPVELDATANDTRFTNENGIEPSQEISATRFSIDNPSWITDTLTYSMAATDGSFNETIEDVQATIDTSAITPGRHTIFVESQDADGNWGLLSAAFLWVEQGDYLVSLSPETDSLSGDAGQPVTYTLQLNNIGLNADTYDVAVDSLWSTGAPLTVGPLDPSTSITFTVQVDIPITATHGESDVALVSVTSQALPTITDSSTLTTQALQHGVEVQPPSDSQSGDPGQAIVYSLQVTNTGDTPDTFTLALSEHTWQTDAPSSLGPLDPARASASR
jgi:hypothetical protein